MGRSVRITRDAFLTLPSLLTKRTDSGISKLLSNPQIKRYFLYSYARVALIEGLKFLDCDQRSNILIPAYICKVAVDPLRELGIEPRFYEVSHHLQPSTAGIKNLIDKKTRGIMVVNYFGFPTKNLEEIKNICKEFDLCLIEDNSHGFLSRNRSRLLGTIGDISISSIWKCLPIPNGGVLFINKESLVDSQSKIANLQTRLDKYPHTSKEIEYKYVVNSLLTNARYRLRLNFLRNISPRLSLKGENRETLGSTGRVRISDVSMRIAAGMNLEEVCQARRQNFNFWLNRLSEREGMDIIFNDLPDGICPLLFPLVVENVESFSMEMRNRGIPVQLWPNLPKEVLDNPNYPSANYLAQHMLTFPVHQSLDRNHLERIFVGR